MILNEYKRVISSFDKDFAKKFERALVAQCCNLSHEMLLFG